MKCLHPIRLIHPTFKKWYLEYMTSKMKKPSRDLIDSFCLKNGIVDENGRSCTELYVPCGKCLYCYQRRQQDWQVRLKKERESSECAYFVTLTYDDDNVSDGLNVSKSDVQKFLKRLRKDLVDVTVRYFCISEYGPSGTLRPHYHLCLFFPKHFRNVDFVYMVVEKAWSKGFVEVTELIDERVNYVANYCIKFFNKSPLGRDENFMLSSRRPGIGAAYLDNDEVVDYHRRQVNNFTVVNGYKKLLPRFYRSKIFDDEMIVKLRYDGVKLHAEFNKVVEKAKKGYASERAYIDSLHHQYNVDFKNALLKFKESKKL